MRKIEFLLSAVLVLILGINANAATITSKAVSGSWTTAANWVGNMVPADGDDVVIVSGANITMVTGTTCAGLTINSGGTFTTLAGILTVNGNVSGAGIISSSATTHIISLTGNWSFNGTSNIESGGPRVNFTGTANQSLTGKINSNWGGYLYIDKPSGTLTLGAAMYAATFNLNAGTFDASTFLLTSPTRIFTAGRIRIGGTASGYLDNFSGSITQPAGSTIEYYSTGANTKYMMQASHGGNVEITGGNGNWYWGDYSNIISGNLTITESVNNIALTQLGRVNGNFTVNTTGSVTTTLTAGDGIGSPINIGGNFTLNGTSNVSFIDPGNSTSSSVNIGGSLTINTGTTLKTFGVSNSITFIVTGSSYVAPLGTLILFCDNGQVTYNYSWRFYQLLRTTYKSEAE
jgi:hypothetical protein